MKGNQNGEHHSTVEINPNVVKGLKGIWDEFNMAIAEMAMLNYGLAQNHATNGMKRLKAAIEYFGGRVD